ncbi:hypothetical protein LCGC14_2663680, partial [marine sediment metagenome]
MNLAETREAFERGEMPKDQYIHAMYALHAGLLEYSDFIRRTDVAEIRITDGRAVITTRSDGIQLICPSGDTRSVPIEILNFGSYELSQARMMLKLIQDSFTVFDVGANAGWYSLLIAKHYPRADVHAFEPIPNTFRLLRDNAALNGLSNIHAHDFGLSDRDGELVFYYEPHYSARASAADLSDGAETLKLQCPVRKMDGLFPQLCSKVDFIKCDCEGGELFVFEGAKETLARFKPIVFTEMLRKWSAKFDYHPNRIIELFESLDYGC